jgi:two-component system, OmpR family, sensor kinase
MWSTRARLAAAYAGILTVSLIVFCFVVFFTRRAATQQDLSAIGHSVSGQVAAAMIVAQRDQPLTRLDTVRVPRPVLDSAHPGAPTGLVLDSVVTPLPELSALLGGRAGYFLVLDMDRRLLYSSNAFRLLSNADQDSLYRVAIAMQPSIVGTEVSLVTDSLLGGRMIMVARSDSRLRPNIGAVVAAAPAIMSEVPSQLLLGTLFLVAPLMLLASVAVAYMLAGNAFKPVDTLINEVEAITDGRSLHRRVTTEEVDEELARLAETLNRMIGRLQTSFGALRRFTADASHELKTPLTVVRADVERAMHPSAAADERFQVLEEAMQEIARMSDLVDSLLTLARADEGRFDLVREPVALEPLVRDVYETALILGEGAGVSVSLPLVEEARVLGDATRLRQLFLNLITNAIKYTPTGGQVEMTLSLRNNNEVGFAVRDTGVGIAAVDLPNVFDRFWRADRARSRKAAADLRGVTERGGFGLGLAIAQWIAHAHGGNLTAQSRLGRGSIFTVLLPIAPADATVDAGAT